VLNPIARGPPCSSSSADPCTPNAAGSCANSVAANTPMGHEVPLEQQRKVTYACLKSDSVEFSATDWLHPTRVPRPGNTVAVYLQEDDYEELRVVFDKLAIGADADLLDDLRDMPFGVYGHLADRYGVHWFFRGAAR
jgi:PhnB protein